MERKPAELNPFTLGILMQIKPSFKQENIEEMFWINDYELYINFKTRSKKRESYIYDTYTNQFRDANYINNNISEEQWNMEFRIRLKNIMQRKNITQTELARRSGIKQSLISRYVQGINMPNGYTISKIATALECDYTDLLW